jgi:hypothetical protein
MPPGEKEILKAGFLISDKGKTDVGASEKPASCFLVRFDDAVYPDRENFETHRGSLEMDLLTDKRLTYFRDWTKAVNQEASGRAAARKAQS